MPKSAAFAAETFCYTLSPAAFDCTMTEKKPLLLLVDDDLRFRSLLETYLEREAFAVAVAGNARQMHKVLDEQPVDLIVLDLTLAANERPRHLSRDACERQHAADHHADGQRR